MAAANFDNRDNLSIGPFIEIGVFWFVLLHIGTIVSNSSGVAPTFLPHIAVEGFAIHSLLAFSSSIGAGSVGKFTFVVLICLLGGIGIFASRAMSSGMDGADTRDFVADATSNIIGTVTGKARAFRRRGPAENLAEAARLIFEEETRSPSNWLIVTCELSRPGRANIPVRAVCSKLYKMNQTTLKASRKKDAVLPRFRSCDASRRTTRSS